MSRRTETAYKAQSPGKLARYNKALEVCTYLGYSNRHDQSMAQGSRAFICQRTMGEYSLPNYGSVVSVNRPVRTRMPGGAGAGGQPPRLPDWAIRLLLLALLTSRSPPSCERGTVFTGSKPGGRGLLWFLGLCVPHNDRVPIVAYVSTCRNNPDF